MWSSSLWLVLNSNFQYPLLGYRLSLLLRYDYCIIFQTLGSFHPAGQTAFVDEVNKAFALLTEGDHFQHFFTDRDGTLKSYSCSYPASIQPAYSAVIQVFLNLVLLGYPKLYVNCKPSTSAPLMHVNV